MPVLTMFSTSERTCLPQPAIPRNIVHSPTSKDSVHQPKSETSPAAANNKIEILQMIKQSTSKK